MNNRNELKEVVKRKYSEIALQDKETNQSSCCGAGGCSTEVYNIMTDDYSGLEGYQEDADLGLGCGLPTEFARIKPGDVVVDLGSGAGNDAFVARHECGPEGKVIGIDFSENMIRKARENAEKLGFHNVEFRQGDIEDMPLGSSTVDVVVSNCVLNLLPDKSRIFNEISRVLRPGGHFSISDIVLLGELPEKLKESAEMYAGCVSGAIQKEDYLDLIRKAGFQNITIQKEKPIYLPDDILQQHLSQAELEEFRKGETGIFSITVYGKKDACCDPSSGCC